MTAAAIAYVVDLCCRHAWKVLLLFLVIAGAAFSFASHHFAIDTDTMKLFPPNLPWRQHQSAFDKAFPLKADQIAIVIDALTPELAEQATAALAAQLQKDPALFPVVYRPDGGNFFQHNGLLFLPTADVKNTTDQVIAAQPLLGPLAADPSLRGLMDVFTRFLEGIQHGQAKLADFERPITAIANTIADVLAGKLHPLAWRTLFTGSQPTLRELRRFILVKPNLDFSALQPGEKASEAIRAAARELDLTPQHGIQVRLTGSVPMSDEEFGTLAQGALRNGILTVLGVALLLWLALRSVRIILAILVTLFVGLLITAAFGLIVVGPYNPISLAFAVLFVGLGVDFGIQFAVRYRAERHALGDLRQALVASGRGVGGSIGLATASIAAGFYAFLPTDYSGVSELGLIAGTGMLVAFVLSLTLLPALLMLVRPHGEAAEIGYRWLAPVDHFLIRRRRLVLTIAAILALGFAVLLPRLSFDFNPLNLRSPKTESVATILDLMKDRTTSPYTIEVLAPSLAQALKQAEKLSNLPEVAGAVTLASFVPRDQDAKLSYIGDASDLVGPTLDPPGIKSAPTDPEVVKSLNHAAAALSQVAGTGDDRASRRARRLARLAEALAKAAPMRRTEAEAQIVPGLKATLGQLNDALQAQPITMKTLPPELVRDWIAADGRARIEVFPKGDPNDNNAMRKFAQAVLRLAPEATGAPISVQATGRTVVNAFIEAGVLAFVAITIMLALVLRRLHDVIMTLLPLMLSGLATLSISVAVGLPINFANIIALPLLFGIGVAFNIYFVVAWRRGTGNLLQSSLTRAILYSALTTGTAFGSLCLSAHPGTASMGNLLALSLACTLVCSLLFLPALLGPPPAAPAKQG
ncbi:MAG TPA: MMPL family transporter [Dongiaceae bacterium]|nr:MMPL family transporter [Dongiaceae bacterium]